MKQIKYHFNNPVNKGTQALPEWADNLFQKSMPYSEANEAIAKKEAYRGEYSIVDDGVEDNTNPTQEERIAKLEEALALLMTVLGKYGVSVEA